MKNKKNKKTLEKHEEQYFHVDKKYFFWVLWIIYPIYYLIFVGSIIVLLVFEFVAIIVVYCLYLFLAPLVFICSSCDREELKEELTIPYQVKLIFSRIGKLFG